MENLKNLINYYLREVPTFTSPKKKSVAFIKYAISALHTQSNVQCMQCLVDTAFKLLLLKWLFLGEK